MDNYESVFRRKELHDMYALGEVSPLDDMYLLEDAADTVKDLNKEIQFYKEYKKRKVSDIDAEIKVLENKIEFFKSVMVSTLKKNDEKKVKFPGSCIISSRNQKPKWSIEDEEEFISSVKKAKDCGEDVEGVINKTVKLSVRKKEADKLLALWESSGKLDDFVKVGKVVSKGEATTSVSIKYLEEEEESDAPEDMSMSIPAKKSAPTEDAEDFDTI